MMGRCGARNRRSDKHASVVWTALTYPFAADDATLPQRVWRTSEGAIDYPVYLADPVW